MTLPVSGSISLTQVMDELRVSSPARAYPISLGDADVRALAGVPSGPISLTDLYGKSSYIPMVIVATNGGGVFSSAASGGTAACNPSVSVTQGNPGYTYLWSFTSNPDGCSLSSTTSTSCHVSKAYGYLANGSASAVLQCQVTDSTGHIQTKTGITSSLSWDSGA